MLLAFWCRPKRWLHPNAEQHCPFGWCFEAIWAALVMGIGKQGKTTLHTQALCLAASSCKGFIALSTAVPGSTGGWWAALLLLYLYNSRIHGNSVNGTWGKTFLGRKYADAVKQNKSWMNVNVYSLHTAQCPQCFAGMHKDRMRCSGTWFSSGLEGLG